MILMHKDIPVADVNVVNGSITAVKSIFNKEHYPVGATTQHQQMAGNFLDNWQKMRCIPKDRQNIEKIIKTIDTSINKAAINTVSLTDCYWFASENCTFWKNLNYHNNGFSENYAQNILLNTNKEINLFIPDFLTDGVLEKYWIYINDTPTLVKFGDLGQEEHNVLCANEVIASQIADLMEISHVHYFPITISDTNKTICGCNTFIKNDNFEFVNALQLYKDNLLKTKDNLYTVFYNMGLEKFISEMIVFDFIIGNTDRHRKNFGIIRNPNTLEFISAAPLFDNGTSLGWNKEFDIKQLSLKPFEDNPLEQLKLANIKLVNIPDEQRVCEIIRDIYKFFLISDEHCEAVQKMVKNNINITKNLLYDK